MKADQSQQFVRTIEIKDRTGRVIGTKEVITYQGLLSKAHDEGLKRIHTSPVQTPSDENSPHRDRQGGGGDGEGLVRSPG